MTPGAETVILTFNQLVPLLVGTRRAGLLRMSDQAIHEAEELHQWLQERDYKVGPYLASCFGKHSWAYCPKLGRLMLREYERHFQDNRDDAFLWWAAVRREAEASQSVPLPRGYEIVKQRLLAVGGPRRCMAQPELSGGYNALSRLCQACSGRTECADGA